MNRNASTTTARNMSEGEIAFEPLRSNQSNPLLIDLVLRRLFYLVDDYETLKECRLVCTKWKEFSDSVFLTKSAFAFNTTHQILRKQTVSENPITIQLLFQSVNLEVRFTAFKFDLKLLTGPVLDTYVNPNKLSMTQLEIYNSELENANFSVDDLIGPNLKKVKLWGRRSSEYASATWFVSLGKLSSVPKIDLTDCAIVINSQGKIAPEELSLDSCRRKLSDQFEMSYIMEMREIIDFHLLTKLYLKGCYDYFVPWKLSLNFGDCVNVKSLTLIGITIIMGGKISPRELTLQDNWYATQNEDQGDLKALFKLELNDYLNSAHMDKLEIDNYTVELDLCSFTIDKLKIVPVLPTHLNNIHRTGITQLNIRLSYLETLDLALLPQTLETLIITNTDRTCDITSSTPIALPNLKKLHFTENFSALLYFRECSSLVDLAIDGSRSEDKVLNIDQLPINLKRLALRNIYEIEVQGQSQNPSKLDVLVFSTGVQYLEDMTYFFELQISHKIQAEIVVFHCYEEENLLYFDEKLVEKVMEMKQKLEIGIVSFGPVKWKSDESFQESELFEIVKRKAEYYLLAGNEGKSLSKARYISMLPFEDINI